jgi:hypothetical protein
MLHNVISLSAASLSHSGEKSLRSEWCLSMNHFVV